MDESWLFRAHSRSRLGGWVRRLGYARFVRAAGGHANDGDFLALSLRWEGEEDLTALLQALGAPLRPAEAGDATVPGVRLRRRPLRGL